MFFRSISQSGWSVEEHRRKQNFLPYLQPKMLQLAAVAGVTSNLIFQKYAAVNLCWLSLLPVTGTAARSWGWSQWVNCPLGLQGDVCREQEGESGQMEECFFLCISCQTGDLDLERIFPFVCCCQVSFACRCLPWDCLSLCVRAGVGISVVQEVTAAV